jgi:hypothetical protein
MPKGVLFWVVFTVIVLFSLYGIGTDRANWRLGGITVGFLILIGILGWHAFGAVV